MEAQPTFVQPGGGLDLHAFGETMTIMLGGGRTGGRLSVAAALTPPGVGPPPHIHHREDELFLVLEGTISYLANDEWEIVRPGGLVYVPRGSKHAYRNDGETPSRHWVITTPSGFEEFFADAAVVFAADGPPDMERVIQVCSKYGIDLLLD